MKRARITKTATKLVSCTGENLIRYVRPVKHMSRMQILEAMIFKS